MPIPIRLGYLITVIVQFFKSVCVVSGQRRDNAASISNYRDLRTGEQWLERRIPMLIAGGIALWPTKVKLVVSAILGVNFVKERRKSAHLCWRFGACNWPTGASVGV
jgi:hypothetical protein